MFITEWICACVAGMTIDGREIKDQQVTDMAETYSQSTYIARIWLEHVRGVDPNSMFKALGDVVEVKAERLTDGALKGKLALFVKLAPHQDLIAMVRNGQKVHLSVEIDPNFAGSGKAYLVGMGVTDSPASLGVGIMKFSANERKQHLFSDPVLAEIKEPVLPTGNNNLFFMQLMQENNAMRGEIKQLVGGFNSINSILLEMKSKQNEYAEKMEKATKALDETREALENISVGGYRRKPATGKGVPLNDNVPY